MTNPYTLRPCVPGDEHALSLVGQATFLETFAGILNGDDIVAHCARQHAAGVYASWLQRQPEGLWLAMAEPGHAPVGYMGLDTPHLPVETGAADIELKRIYVLSRYHGGGLGRELMEQAVATARWLEKSRLLLGVYSGNARALRFYQRGGFQIVGERRFRVGNNEYDDFVLARAL